MGLSFQEERQMEKKRNIAWLTIGFVGIMAGCFCVNVFNRYVLISLPLAARMISMIAVYWLIALVPIIIMACNKTKLSALGFSKEDLFAQVIVGVAIAAVTSVVFTLIPHVAGFGDWVDNGRRYKFLWQFLYEFIQCIIAIGAVEEYVFRGFLYAMLKDIFGKEWVSVLISSVLFGLFHIFGGSIVQIFMTMCIGVLWCLLKLKIKHCSLLSLIIAHGIYDALITVWASFLM